MIAFLRGRLVARGGDWAELDVGGIGFHVLMSQAAAQALPAVGCEVSVPTALWAREDAISLYGFADDTERRAFRALTAVTGIGPRTALAVLSVLPPAALAEALQRGDVEALTRAPGVGRKLAQRLVVELGERAAALAVAGGSPSTAATAPGDGPTAEAHYALRSLGYSPEEAEKALAAARAGGADADTAALIRAALRVLAGRR